MKTNNKFNYIILFLIITGVFILSSCADPVPTDYIEQKFVEAYLLVNEPIKDIVLMNTQPVADSFSYANSLIRDADVKIIGDGQVFELKIDTGGDQGYYYPDSTYLVKPNTHYKLQITIPGYPDTIYAETTTPGTIKYLSPELDSLYYPKDTINLPPLDTYRLEWEKVPDINFYIITVKCLDTLYYGKYLHPPTDEMNRRVFKPYSEGARGKEITNTMFVPNTKVPVVWLFFKWFGLQQVSVYAPDPNYLNWVIQHLTKNQYDSKLSNIKKGLGVFGSASVARGTTFLIKNQP